MDSGQTGRLRALSDGCYPFGFVGELKAMYSLAWPTVCVCELQLYEILKLNFSDLQQCCIAIYM